MPKLPLISPKTLSTSNYLISQENEISKYYEEIFRRVIEKIKVRSMVEVEFVFKVGVKVREILG